MKTLINKIKTALTTIVLLAAAGLMAGFGFVVIALIACFAFIAVGIALLAAPFVGAPDTDAAA